MMHLPRSQVSHHCETRGGRALCHSLEVYSASARICFSKSAPEAIEDRVHVRACSCFRECMVSLVLDWGFLLKDARGKRALTSPRILDPELQTRLDFIGNQRALSRNSGFEA